jgi:DNA processing protein
LTDADNPTLTDNHYLAWLVNNYMPPAKALHQLLQVCGSAQLVFSQWGPDLWRKVLPRQTAVAKRWAQGPFTADTPDMLAAQLHQLGIAVLGFADFPPALQAINDPPACLFVRGNAHLLQAERSLGIVGTRTATEYSRQLISQLLMNVQAMAPVIISGLAAGVDGMAHQAALANALPTVAVMGTGLSLIYPQHHTGLARQIVATGGLLVSEYPLTYGGDKHTFPARNRIIAGLSQGVLVTECPRRSGAMITARFALDSGREVFALPGNVGLPNAEGPNHLLAQGAHLVQTGADISEVLKWPTPSTKNGQNLTVNTVNSDYAGDASIYTGAVNTIANNAANTAFTTLPMATPIAARPVSKAQALSAQVLLAESVSMPLFSPPPLQPDAPPPALTPDLLRVWQAMPPAGQAISVTALEGALAQTPPDPLGNTPQPLGVTLTLLALDGYIEQLPGQFVQRT